MIEVRKVIKKDTMQAFMFKIMGSIDRRLDGITVKDRLSDVLTKSAEVFLL